MSQFEMETIDAYVDDMREVVEDALAREPTNGEQTTTSDASATADLPETYRVLRVMMGKKWAAVAFIALTVVMIAVFAAQTVSSFM